MKDKGTREKPFQSLTEMEKSYLRVLRSFKLSPVISGDELKLVERYAAFLDSPVALAYIFQSPRWFSNWEIKEALLSNEYTPPGIRERIERALAIFELMREMDLVDLRGPEKKGIQDEIKNLYRLLPVPDRIVVKTRAYLLSKSRITQKTGELFRLLRLLDSKEITPERHDSLKEEIRVLLAELPPEEREKIRKKALSLTRRREEVDELEEAFFFEPDLETVAGQEEPVKRAETVEIEGGIDDILAREPVGPASEPGIRKAYSDSDFVEEGDQIALIEQMIDAEEESEARELDLPEEAAVPADSPEEGEARVTDDPRRLTHLSFSRDPAVANALLHNSNINEKHVLNIVKSASPAALRNVFNSKKWFSKPRIRETILQNPNAPTSVSLEILSFIAGFEELFKILKNSKVRNLEAKSKAKLKLLSLFKSMGTDEKILKIKKSGGDLLREFAVEIFRDENLLQRLLDDPATDHSIVLKVVRSRTASRNILSRVAGNPKWISHYDILLELTLNPKTPREMLSALTKKLKPADRKMVLSSRGLLGVGPR